MRRKPINPTSMSKISETSASIGVPHSHKKSFLRLFKGQHWASRIDLGVGSTGYQCGDAKKNKKWMDNIYCTPRKNNMEAKNNLIEKHKKHLADLHFWVPCSCSRVIYKVADFQPDWKTEARYQNDSQNASSDCQFSGVVSNLLLFFNTRFEVLLGKYHYLLL